MAKISLEIKTTKNGKKKTTNVGYINPNASNEKLLRFATMLIALTTETYEGATKVTKEVMI